MYESSFQMHRRPFLSAPTAQRYFASSAIEQARQTLTRTIECSQGPGVLIGPAGTGKSLLCHVLGEHFHDTLGVVMLASGRFQTVRALLQTILFELGLPYRDLDEGDLRLALMEHLQPNGACPNGVLLIVDEAHTLPLRVLEEVRMITNVVQDGQARVRLVLAGGPILEERFASPKLESFNQRIAARCYLQSMNRSETFDYVRWHVEEAGGHSATIFSDDALQAVYDATDGIPRLVNQVCDHALMLAAVGGAAALEAGGIEEAWADLQQLPAPAAMSNQITLGNQPVGETSSVIEFGELDDEPADEAAAAAEEVPELAEAVVTETGIVEDELGLLQKDVTDELQEAGDTELQLDEIELHLKEASEDMLLTLEASHSTVETDAGKPATGKRKKKSPNPADPFDEQFDEEELVVDRYASMDEAFGQQPAVSCDESKTLAEILGPLSLGDDSQAVSQRTEEPVLIEIVEEQTTAAEHATSDEQELDEYALESETTAETTQTASPDVDLGEEEATGAASWAMPSMEEPSDEEPAFSTSVGEVDVDIANISEQVQSVAISMDSPPAENTDLTLDVGDSAQDLDVTAPLDAAGQPRRREYRHLFSTLRRN